MHPACLHTSLYAGFCNIILAGSPYIGPRHPGGLFACRNSSSASRAQRASARNMNSAPSTSDPLVSDRMAAAISMQSIPDSDPLVMAVDSDAPSISGQTLVST